jgi:hypothetical protein
LVVILTGSALKLLNVQNSALAWSMLILVVVAIPLWGATNASLRPDWQWKLAGYRRTTWVTAQAVGAPFGIGLPIALVYLVRVRRALASAGRTHDAEGEPLLSST